MVEVFLFSPSYSHLFRNIQRVKFRNVDNVKNGQQIGFILHVIIGYGLDYNRLIGEVIHFSSTNRSRF